MAIPTMLISGQKYAKVKDRVAEFHRMYDKGVIETDFTIRDGFVIFVAYIFCKPSSERNADANGHALGKLTGGKTFEKTETIAVGRALAFLGIMADGSIATAEEMEDIDIAQTDEYKDAQYRLEDLLERCNIVDESVEQVRRGYGQYDISQLYKATDWLRKLMDEQRVANGNTTAKERNKQVEAKLKDEKS